MIGVMVVATWAAHRKNGFFVFHEGQGWEYTVVDRRRRLGGRDDRPGRRQHRPRHRPRLDGVGRLDRRRDRRRPRRRRRHRPAGHLLPTGTGDVTDHLDATSTSYPGPTPEPPRSSFWRAVADADRRSPSRRSGSGPCSSPPRSRSTSIDDDAWAERAEGDLRRSADVAARGAGRLPRRRRGRPGDARRARRADRPGDRHRRADARRRRRRRADRPQGPGAGARCGRPTTARTSRTAGPSPTSCGPATTTVFTETAVDGIPISEKLTALRRRQPHARLRPPARPQLTSDATRPRAQTARRAGRRPERIC